MCYSEELKKDMNAYQTDKGWVLVGYKAVVECEEHPGKYRALYQGPKNDQRGDSLYYWVYGGQENVHYHYEFGKPLDDKHGFHLGASRRGAMKGLIRSTGTGGSWGNRDWEPKARYIRRNSIKWHVIRCLVPQDAVEENHATTMMALPPGERETWVDVQTIVDYQWKKTLAKVRPQLAFWGMDIATELDLFKVLRIEHKIIIPEDKTKIQIPEKKLEKQLAAYTVNDMIAVNSSYKTVPWAKAR